MLDTPPDPQAKAVQDALEAVAQAASAARAAASAASASAERIAALEQTVAQLRSENKARSDLVMQLRERLAQVDSTNIWMLPLLLLAGAWPRWPPGWPGAWPHCNVCSSRPGGRASRPAAEGVATDAPPSRQPTSPAPFVTAQKLKPTSAAGAAGQSARRASLAASRSRAAGAGLGFHSRPSHAARFARPCTHPGAARAALRRAHAGSRRRHGHRTAGPRRCRFAGTHRRAAAARASRTGCAARCVHRGADRPGAAGRVLRRAGPGRGRGGPAGGAPAHHRRRQPAALPEAAGDPPPPGRPRRLRTHAHALQPPLQCLRAGVGRGPLHGGRSLEDYPGVVPRLQQVWAGRWTRWPNSKPCCSANRAANSSSCRPTARCCSCIRWRVT
jgi:hypothetical protein